MTDSDTANPGRWCEVCQSHGFHHTDRHPVTETGLTREQLEERAANWLAKREGNSRRRKRHNGTARKYRDAGKVLVAYILGDDDATPTPIPKKPSASDRGIDRAMAEARFHGKA